jgi:hypothetical protein
MTQPQFISCPLVKSAQCVQVHEREEKRTIEKAKRPDLFEARVPEGGCLQLVIHSKLNIQCALRWLA